MTLDDVTISVKTDIDHETVERVSREIHRCIEEAVQSACWSGAAKAIGDSKWAERFRGQSEMAERLRTINRIPDSATGELESYCDMLKTQLHRAGLDLEKTLRFADSYSAGPMVKMEIEARHHRDTRYLREALAYAQDKLRIARSRASVGYDAVRHEYLGTSLIDMLERSRSFQYEKVAWDPASDEHTVGYLYRAPLEYKFREPAYVPFLASGFYAPAPSKEKIVKEKTKKFYVWDCTGSYPTGFVTEKEANAYATSQARITGRSYTVLKALRRMAKSEPPVKTEPIR